MLKEATISCNHRVHSHSLKCRPSLITIFAVHMKKVWTPSYLLTAQCRLIGLDRCLCWVPIYFVGLVLSCLIKIHFECCLLLSRRYSTVKLIEQGTKNSK